MQAEEGLDVRITPGFQRMPDGPAEARKRCATTPRTMRADLIANLANCPIGGEDATHFDDGSWTRDHLHLQLSGYRIEVHQVANSRSRDLAGRFVHTTNVIIREVSEERRTAALSVVTDLAWLLAFATMSQVSFYGYEHGSSGHRWSARGILVHTRSVVDIDDGAAVRQFIQSTWKGYRRLKLSRKLQAVIDYIVQAAGREQVMEIKLLLTFVALESLKATYARSAGIPFVKGKFRNAQASQSPNLAKAPSYSFEDLLRMMLKEVRIKKGLKRAIDLRNEIVHYGLSRRPFPRIVETYDSCQNLIREYLLRLLGFSGEYFAFDSRSWKVLRP